MLETLKKLIGVDKESAEARKMAAEQERRERENRIAEQAAALKRAAEVEKENV